MRGRRRRTTQHAQRVLRRLRRHEAYLLTAEGVPQRVDPADLVFALRRHGVVFHPLATQDAAVCRLRSRFHAMMRPIREEVAHHGTAVLVQADLRKRGIHVEEVLDWGRYRVLDRFNLDGSSVLEGWEPDCLVIGGPLTAQVAMAEAEAFDAAAPADPA